MIIQLAAANEQNNDVLHKFKLSVGRDEADSSIRIELRQSHTLMELTIIQLYRVVTCRPSFANLVES